MSRSLGTFFVLLIASLQPAVAINENAGTTGFNFLKIGVGARATALGGAYAGVSGDLESTAWNPAGLLGIKNRVATVSLTRYLSDTKNSFLSFAVPGEQRVWAFSLNSFTYGDMRRTNEDGEDQGSFSASDAAAYITMAQRLWHNRLTFGINFKAVYSSIDEFSSDAYMVDLGLLIDGPLKGMKLGASLANLGSVRSGYTENFKDSLPVNIRLGLSHRPAHTPLPMIILMDLNMPNDSDPYLSFGTEIRIGSGFYLRPGYSTQQPGRNGDPLGLTAGAGFTMHLIRLDYAFNSYPDLDEVHRISLSGNF